MEKINLNEIYKKAKQQKTKELKNKWNLSDFLEKKILTVGTYDLLHPGHTNLIDHCIEVSGHESNIVISVSTDKWNKLKGKKADQSQDERIRILKIKYPKAKIILEDHNFPEETWPQMWDENEIDLIIMGGDHYKTLDYINGVITPKGREMKIAFFQRTDNISSTLIRLAKKLEKNKGK